MANRFYAIFHGLVSFIEYTNRYRAILIDMSDHRVALGHWLTERTVPRGVSLTLGGVDSGGTGTLDGQKNIVVTLPSLPTVNLAKYRYADIYLPKPSRIYSFWTADALNQLTGTTAVSSTKYSAVQVFEYNVAGDLTSVSVTGGGFEWDVAGDTDLPDGDRIAILHVVNEPETTVPDAHAVEEFARGSLICGVDLQISTALPFPNTNVPVAPAGLLEVELRPLALREPAVLPLIDYFRVHAAGGATPIGGSRFCGTICAVVNASA